MNLKKSCVTKSRRSHIFFSHNAFPASWAHWTRLKTRRASFQRLAVIYLWWVGVPTVLAETHWNQLFGYTELELSQLSAAFQMAKKNKTPHEQHLGAVVLRAFVLCVPAYKHAVEGDLWFFLRNKILSACLMQGDPWHDAGRLSPASNSAPRTAHHWNLGLYAVPPPSYGYASPKPPYICQSLVIGLGQLYGNLLGLSTLHRKEEWNRFPVKYSINLFWCYQHQSVEHQRC